MSSDLQSEFTSLTQQLLLEQKKFQEALKADKEFHVLKEIRENIKRLEAKIRDRRPYSFVKEDGHLNNQHDYNG